MMIAPKPTVSELRAPKIVRESRSRPELSPPSRWPPAPKPRLAMIPPSVSLGSSSGRIGASSAPTMMRVSQAMHSQAPMPRPPSLRRAGRSASTSAAAICSSTAPGGTPVVGASVDSDATGLSGDGSGMADPRIEHDVQDVDERVERHVGHRDDGDVGLQRHVLAGGDGLHQLQPQARELEHLLDDHRAADERAGVEGGDREEREAP